MADKPNEWRYHRYFGFRMTTAVPKAATSQFRWVICALLFFATVIAYVDRGVLAFLEKTLEQIIGWNSEQYSYMTAAFQTAYAIGLLCAGAVTDRLGTRKAFSYAILLWSFAAMLPGAAVSPLTFGIALFFLGLGEAANFPACIKTVAEWFPKRERALATGLFNSGANIGAMAVPAVVPFLNDRLGWRGAFVATGATGFVWLAFWLWLYRRPAEHPAVSPTELALIQSDPPDPPAAKMSWSDLLPLRETWAFAFAKFFTDPIWWFYLFWLPRYVTEKYHLTLSKTSAPILTVYAMSCIGSICGGWLSSSMLKRGKSLNAARKTALGICAVVVIPVLYAPYAENMWLMVIVVGLAMAAHQGWSANIFTLTSDLFPRSAVASVVGIGGMMGAIGGVIMQLAAGRIVQYSYLPLFLFCGSGYAIALLIVHLLTPKMKPVRLS